MKIDNWIILIYNNNRGFKKYTIINAKDNCKIHSIVKIFKMGDSYSNPFIGLRAFKESETNIFFGREKLISKIISNIQAKNFTSLIGSKSVGKTSILQAGIIPKLKSETLNEDTWHIIHLEGNDNIISTLANKLSHFKSKNNTIHTSKINLEKKLRKSVDGLVEIVKTYNLKSDEKLLIIIDKFENLFDFKNDNETSINEDSRLFINQLISSIKQEIVPIKILIGLDSNHLSDCSLITGLTEQINKGQVFIPEFDGTEIKKILTKTTQNSPYSFIPEFLYIMVSDLTGASFTLNRLQHTAKKAINAVADDDYNQEKKINLDIYNNIGTTTNALNFHLEEVYSQLDNSEKIICESIFKRIVKLPSNDPYYTIPNIKEIAEICKTTNTEITKIISKFSNEKIRAIAIIKTTNTEEKLSKLNKEEFISTINPNSHLELSTPLISQSWQRLKEWSKMEVESAIMYHKIHKSADLFAKKMGPLYFNSELGFTEKWISKQKPNANWAKRYQLNYELVKSFIEKSRQENKKIKDRRLAKQEQKIKMARRIAIGVCLASIIPIGLAVYAIKERKKAKISETTALINMQKAETAKERAVTAEKDALVQKTQAEKDKQIAQKALVQEQVAKDKADEAKKSAVTALNLATINAKKAKIEKQNALKAKREALDAKAIADTLKFKNKTKILSMEVLQNDRLDYSQNRKSILKAYKLNQKYANGNVFSELYMALRKTISKSKKTKLDYIESNHPLTSISTYNNIVVTGNESGEIQFYKTSDSGELNYLNQYVSKHKIEIRSLCFNPFNNHLLYGTNKGEVIIIDPSTVHMKQVTKLSFEKTEVIKELISINNGFYSIFLILSHKYLYLYKFDQEYSLERKLEVDRYANIKKTSGSKNSFIFSNDNEIQIAKISENLLLEGRKVITENTVTISNISEDGSLLVYGDKMGNVYLHDLDKNSTIPIQKHESEVTGIVISTTENLKKINSSSYDNRIISTIISKDNTAEHTYSLDSDQGWVYDIKPSLDNKFIYSIGKKNELKLWYSDTKDMIELIQKTNNQ